MKYIRDLAKVDDRVMSVSPQNHKESRPFVGVIVICDDKQYCIPLTSPKEKHKTMNNREDFSRIVDSDGKILGALNFNNMIPVNQSVITPINIKPSGCDTPKECGRKKYLISN
jgi:protein AbiQ